jgi:5-methylcytosine-specific restriction endonuclease McrA
LDLRKSRARTTASIRRGKGLCTYCALEKALKGVDRCIGCKLVSLEKTGREWRGNKMGRAKVKKKFAGVPRAEVLALWASQQGRCAVTGVRLRLVGQEHDSVSLDHILPFSRGGSHIIKNLRFTCYLVNMLKRDLTETEFLEVIGEDGPSRLRKFIEARAAI